MPSPALFSRESLGSYESAIAHASATVSAAVSAAQHPVRSETPAHLRRRVRSIDLEQPTGSLTATLEESHELFLDHAVWFHNPRYMAHLNCPVATAAIAADLVASSINTSVDTWDQSLGATHIEQALIDWTAQRLGLGELADGIFTSGGTASNLQAMLMARGRARRLGHLDATLCILTTDEAHFSVRKAANVLGLGPQAVVCVDTDDTGRMSPEALRHTLQALSLEGRVPMAVSTTAGTTDRGVIDPLAEIAAVCSVADVWFHVDAAVGGGLVTSGRHRHLLDGIGCADSVTVDFHKTWYQPVAASAVFVRDRSMLGHAGFNAEYLNPADAGVPNLVDKSLQTTRRFDAFKLWVTLRTIGADTIGSWLDTCLDLTQDAFEIAEAVPELETLERPSTHMLLFRFVGDAAPEEQDRLNDTIRTELFTGGETVVARTRHDGRTWLKLTLLNPMATVADLRAAFDDVVACGRRLSAHDDAAQAASGAVALSGEEATA